MNIGDIERWFGASAGVASLPCHVNAVGGKNRLGLHAEKRASALPAVSPDLADHVQDTVLA